MMVSAGNPVAALGGSRVLKNDIYESIGRLSVWLEKNECRAYDTFDGLNARFLRPLTFESNFLRTVLQQGVRRFPINLRPFLGIAKSRSTKGQGYLARGFMRLAHSKGDASWRDKADFALRWLTENQSPGYSGACWGNHFDYQSRSFYLPKNAPTAVWTSLIGHAFLDAYDYFQRDAFLEVAVSSCEHILYDLERFPDGESLCIGYIPARIPAKNKQVHNANTLAASLLARTYSYTRNQSYRALAERAMHYTAKYQRPEGSWYYGEAANLHWIDNFHTAYVLDCFKTYSEATGDDRFRENLTRGYNYWRNTFFLSDGTPKYYDHKTLPIDIQCCSQAVDTLVGFSDSDPGSLLLAIKVAKWTIEHMQDRSGYFYYRRYSRSLVNKTPTLHWGQATMLCALAGLYQSL
ncbi:MAG: hypothetical protein AUH86_03205 [Acidobacteria bacterium 13_1_40CM_4_58_4]|nr:MAG: hypothetical protein AUH86_03205 [Acidobacteria bacterium 13_1_40CM_4_58_4]